MPYQNNTTARLSAEFTDQAGSPVDPATVSVSVQPPRGATPLAYRYGTDIEVVKDSTGNYHVDVLLDKSGIWWYRWQGTDTDQIAAEQSLVVAGSQIGASH